MFKSKCTYTSWGVGKESVIMDVRGGRKGGGRHRVAVEAVVMPLGQRFIPSAGAGR